MVQVKSKTLLAAFALAPTAFLIISYIKQAPLWLLGAAISLFFIVATVPACRKRENMWMFVLVALFSFPVNTYLTYIITPVVFETYNKLTTIIYMALVFFVLFSVEEILFAFITRIIWRKQYRLFPKEFDDL